MIELNHRHPLDRIPFSEKLSPCSAGAETSATADAGRELADHQLLRCIGCGGYGEVWLARHSQLHRLRAVKIVDARRFAESRPFQREFEGLQHYEPISRGHPNLVP